MLQSLKAFIGLFHLIVLVFRFSKGIHVSNDEQKYLVRLELNLPHLRLLCICDTVSSFPLASHCFWSCLPCLLLAVRQMRQSTHSRFSSLFLVLYVCIHGCSSLNCTTWIMIWSYVSHLQPCFFRTLRVCLVMGINVLSVILYLLPFFHKRNSDHCQDVKPRVSLMADECFGHLVSLIEGGLAPSYCGDAAELS